MRVLFRDGASVWRRPFDVLHDQELARRSGRLDLQAELLAERGKEVRGGVSGGVVGVSPR